MNIGSS